jgi:fused signal recognition particle receptor
MFGSKEGGGFFERLKKGLTKTRESFTRNLDQIIFGEKVIDQNLFDELEETFISADLGPAFTYDLIDQMKLRVKRDQLNNPEVLKTILKEHIRDILDKAEAAAPPLKSGDGRLHTIMVVGVNGTGKTTTIGKLANVYKEQGIPVALAAADTFRAAAIEQLEVWSKRVGAPLFKQKMGSDPSAVVFDAVKAAPSQGAKVLIIDTAGRLHTKVNLMEELKKMKRIMGRELAGAPDEVLLVVDATTGQNALNQAQIFQENIGITGIVLTKLDGTSKGGILIRIVKELQVPIKYIGIGEKIEDLRPFKSEEFVNALFE